MSEQHPTSTPECQCFPVPSEYWTTHYGAVDPATTHDPNPECRACFPENFEDDGLDPAPTPEAGALTDPNGVLAAHYGPDWADDAADYTAQENPPLLAYDPNGWAKAAQPYDPTRDVRAQALRAAARELWSPGIRARVQLEHLADEIEAGR